MLIVLACLAGSRLLFVEAGCSWAAPNVAHSPFSQILLDDMDVLLNSSHRAFLPRTWQLVADAGTVFNNMVVGCGGAVVAVAWATHAVGRAERALAARAWPAVRGPCKSGACCDCHGWVTA